MAKKKISSKDFLNLLDDQESSNEKAAFKPRKPTPSKLGPVQKELLDLAMSKTPRWLKKMIMFR